MRGGKFSRHVGAPHQDRRKGECEIPAGRTCRNPQPDLLSKIFAIGKNPKLDINRPAKFGGDVSYDSYEKLEKDFAEKKLHPMDLKNAVAEKIIEILKPATEHLNKPEIKKLKAEMDKLIITR